MIKILKIIAIITLTFLLVGVSVGCAASSLKSIIASPNNISLAVNATQQLTITATYTNGSLKNVTVPSTYKSSNEKIATVTKTGLVKGIAKGSASITVSYSEGNVTKTVMVPVTVR
jgi:uncharacterized protein YjdB